MQKKEKVNEFEDITIKTNKTEKRKRKNGQTHSDQLKNIMQSSIHVTGISEELSMCVSGGGRGRKIFE